MVDTFIYKTRCNNFLKQLLISVSSQMPMFNPRLLQKQLVVDEVAMGQVYLKVLQFSHVSVPSVPHAHSFIHAITKAI